jgi:hypothetical protein
MKSATVGGMIITLTMDDHRLSSIEAVESFLAGVASVDLRTKLRKEKYAWVEQILIRFRYQQLRRKEKAVIRELIVKTTGYSDIQAKRLIGQYLDRKTVRLSLEKKHRFPVKYTTDDVALLAKVDNAHLRLAGPATKRILAREFSVFGKAEFERLATISVSHLYNLRERDQYTGAALTYVGTRSVNIPIGIRKKPHPEGEPGHIRVDSVHQGDKDKEKGVYHINVVDEVTQWEVVACVEGISEHFLMPALEEALATFPFVILGFHSDNGSEYINGRVAELLGKLLIEQTKSRSRRTNDNALVETKNGSVIRKHMGRTHIPKRRAPAIHGFYRSWFNEYLAYHRPCGFAITTIDRKGKEKKKYDQYETPYERFRSLPNAEQYLKPGVTFEMLDHIAKKMSDTDYAIMMQKEKVELHQKLSR